jgi:hypothetical protein
MKRWAMKRWAFDATCSLMFALLANCVPSGNAPSWDAGAKPAATKTIVERPNVLREIFMDDFERAEIKPVLSTLADPTNEATLLLGTRRLDGGGIDGGFAGDGGKLDASAGGRFLANADAGSKDGGIANDAGRSLTNLLPEQNEVNVLGPNWQQAKTKAWHLEKGRLCGEGAMNHGVWLQKPIPINARIEFDAIASDPKGDLKAEAWGDGQSAATTVSYNNATSYLAILGGWENKFHVLARIDEHATTRKEIVVDRESDDPRKQPVSVGQSYRFRIERSNGRTVHFSVGETEYLRYEDAEPLAGIGHDHFGFNNWKVKTCFDNVRVTPL